VRFRHFVFPGATLPSRQIPPSASALMESLRGTGYSLETALADLIDNSIAAGAKNIDLSLDWKGGNPIAVVTDDGAGMHEDELVAAMRFGGLGPRTVRAGTDLGRFGLGLKTASLSQCRRLTVSSARDGKSSVFCWDMDYIGNAGGGWDLLEGAPAGLESLAGLPHGRAAGTAVIWDRIDFGRVRERPTSSTFLLQIERAERHIALVFHRYLDGDARRVRMTINGRRIKGWDPFIEDHAAILDSGGERISVRGFVLPHPDRFANTAAMADAAGPDGWVAQQGFYVYRQKRLLSGGGWLAIGGTKAWTREEFNRLARIRVDLPNSIDEDWRIDIRKAQARPPEALRPALARIAEDVRRIARDVFFHRGGRTERNQPGNIAKIWQVNAPPAVRRYTVRRDHPLVAALSKKLGPHSDLLTGFVELIERTVPVDRIAFDAVENGPSSLVTPSAEEHSILLSCAMGIVRSMMMAGLDEAAAISAVSRMEPFDTIPDVAEKLTPQL
jgi:hypothetical protein